MTCSTCSRCTLRIWAMATPTFCTSLGPRWRSTWAASVSPRDNSRIAAFSTLLSLATRASFIIVDPLLHDLGHAARILGHQPFNGIQLCIIPFTGAGQQNALRSTKADPIGRQLAIQAAHLAQLDVPPARAQGLVPASTGDVVQHRTQHAEHQHQDEENTDYLLDHVPEPGLGVEGDVDDLIARVGHKGGVD